MKGLLLALGFLTRLPVPSGAASPEAFAAAIRCYPLVGLVVGAFVAGAGWLGNLADPWVGALAALVCWVAVTGALHLDGLADVADGVGAAHGDRSRLVAVMADPHVGSFGVAAIVLQLLAKLILLHGAASAGGLPLLLVPFAARLGPLAWARWLRPLKRAGLGATVASAVRPRDLWGWGAVLAAACVGAPFLVVTPLLIALAAAWFRARLGGITGDAHGAGIELVETGLLVALVAIGQA
ncbi:adenosylcobinamide-GDP ribazoletransferase [Sphingomonas desiccabilis]|uniref:Adenosylcobinamide-GDP ribazoletransferase n=1 Tax=Sphingomonas desiccabilis TaxID=429134 RepID=A0A4Q2IWX6_9SPHN|nr:adenosylcobinamide-GDP ribazoletransferase [Sphingomonas desiccabilis]MBB3910492.1 adenosylcobinamide-GDP ribazoletransferase [Sphingomonas desiccabilis]RXZ35135.1 adenosylcobinamide-GDP ribazoletransferase [Sphingomonas desiccabilis]